MVCVLPLHARHLTPKNTSRYSPDILRFPEGERKNVKSGAKELLPNINNILDKQPSKNRVFENRKASASEYAENEHGS